MKAVYRIRASSASETNFGFLLRRSKVARELYLAVKGRDGALVAQVDPNKVRQAREFAPRLNTWAIQAGDG
jgi:hypothetical protein